MGYKGGQNVSTVGVSVMESGLQSCVLRKRGDESTAQPPPISPNTVEQKGGGERETNYAHCGKLRGREGGRGGRRRRIPFVRCRMGAAMAEAGKYK